MMLGSLWCHEFESVQHISGDGALFYRGGMEEEYVTPVTSDMQDLASGVIWIVGLGGC